MNKTMKIIKIFLRVQLKTSTLKQHIRKNLNKLSNLQYISIQTKFMFNKNNFPTYSLGKKCYIDLTNPNDIQFYVEYLSKLYEIKNEHKKLCKRLTGIYIQVASANKKDYLDFINSIKQENPKNIFSS